MPPPVTLETVKLYPLVGLKSLRVPEAGGAWRLFTLAKNLAGVADHIERESLREVSESLGVKEYQFNRWLSAARGLDLFKDVQRMSGEWMLILPSQKKAAEIMGSEKLGKPVTLPTELLFKKGWRAYVFAAWQASVTNNGDRLVSQKKQEEITGIDPQTQRQFNKQAGVVSTKNFAQSNVHANHYSSVLEYGNRACLYEFWNHTTHQKMLGWRIPDSRVFPLYGSDFSNKSPRKMSLFNRTPEQQSATLKTLRSYGIEGKDLPIKEIYTLDRQSAKGNNLWIHLPV